MLQRLGQLTLLLTQGSELEGRGCQAIVLRGEHPFEGRRGGVGLAKLGADLRKRLLVVEVGRIAPQRLFKGLACLAPMTCLPVEMAKQSEEVRIVAPLPDRPFQ